MMTKSHNRNQIYFQIYSYSQKSLLLFYVITLYYLALGLSYTTIALISVIGTISTLISEIPTGVIADKWSRKKSLQIAECLKLLSIIMMLGGQKTAMLYIASFVWGIADSCESGASQAMLYDSFDDKNEYEQFISKIYSRGYVISAVATILATSIFAYNIYLPLWISIFLTIVSLIALTLFQEDGTTNNNVANSINEINTEALMYIKSSPKLLNVLLLMSLCTIIVMSVNTYTQPLLLDKGTELSYLGLLMFTYNILMSMGSKLYKKLKFKNLHFIVAGIMTVTAITMGLFSNFSAIVIVGLFRIANGVIWPALTSVSNNLIKTEIRATVMSYQNMVTSLICIVLDPCIGVVLDYLGVSRFYTVFGLVCATMLILIFAWSNSLNKDDKEHTIFNDNK